MLYKESLRGVAAILVVFFHIEWGHNKELFSFVHNNGLPVDFAGYSEGLLRACILMQQKGIPSVLFLLTGQGFPYILFVMMFWFTSVAFWFTP